MITISFNEGDFDCLGFTIKPHELKLSFNSKYSSENCLITKIDDNKFVFELDNAINPISHALRFLND